DKINSSSTLLPVTCVLNVPSNRSSICFCCSSIVSNLFSNSTTLVEPVYTSHLFSFGFQTAGAVSPAAFGNSLYFQSSLAIPLHLRVHILPSDDYFCFLVTAICYVFYFILA